MNLDNHLEGDFNPENPSNQPDIPSDEINSVTDAYEDKDEEAIYSKIEEARLKVRLLREKFKQSDDVYTLNKLTEIYNLL